MFFSPRGAFVVRPQRAPGYNTLPWVDMQAGMQHPSLDGYEEVGVLGRG